MKKGNTENPLVVLFDSEERYWNLLPLCYNRPICDFRVGITTLREKWEWLLGCECKALPVEYLRECFGEKYDDGDVLYIASWMIPDEGLAEKVENLRPGEALYDGDEVVAWRGSADGPSGSPLEGIQVEGVRKIMYVFDIFLRNAELIREDFRRLTGGRQSQPLSETNRVIGDYVDADGCQLLFIEEGASVEGATLNLSDGPIYIGANAQVMEGATLRGPLALCHDAKIRMGARIYGGTTFGPYCKVGGEVDNTVIFGYSNKAHDGYLGNAVIGEWCNIGAGTNASNLKNDYSKIRIWNYATRSFMRTDLQFCGLIMGDHSKAGINCMFNTATVLGVGVNIHGSGFPRVFVPSFSEGSPVAGFTNVAVKKFYDIAERVMSRRGIKFTESDKAVYAEIYDRALKYKK